MLVALDLGQEELCEQAVQQVIDKFGRVDILVNNAGEQHPQKTIEDISDRQLQRTFRTNVFAMFYLVKAALKNIHAGGCIINTAGVTAYRGSPTLLDYAAAKGAIVAFTRSLALNLAPRKIRVNAVAPGPVGAEVPLGRSGEPDEVALCYVFLATQDSASMTGQTLHPNGGEIVNG